MSVINQMLRDLDTRQKGGHASLDPALGRLTRDTVSVLPPAKSGKGRSLARPLPLVLGLVLVLVVAGGWLVRPGGDTAPRAAAPAPAVLAVEPPKPQTAPLQAAMVQPQPAVAVAAAPSAKPTPAVAVPAPPAVAPRASEPAARSVASPSLQVPTGASLAAATTPPAARPKPEALPSPINRTQAAGDVMAQARTMWDQGARDGATQLLRDAIAVLARSGADSVALLLQAVKELTRLELAQGHAGAALDMLQRLEPQLANQADAWGLRGNVAQRLGRHAESAQAYLTALSLRPGEARWMLGAAVSLAADGHTAQAAELAQQARQRGALSSEVEAYLRQQGVLLP